MGNVSDKRGSSDKMGSFDVYLSNNFVKKVI